MRILKRTEREALVQNLVDFAKKIGAVDAVDYSLIMSTGPVEDKTALCQVSIKLPIYTVAHAAAWLGLSKRGVVEAYRSKRLRYIQPGREVLFLHEDLVEFAKSRRYEL